MLKFQACLTGLAQNLALNRESARNVLDLVKSKDLVKSDRIPISNITRPARFAMGMGLHCEALTGL